MSTSLAGQAPPGAAEVLSQVLEVAARDMGVDRKVNDGAADAMPS